MTGSRTKAASTRNDPQFSRNGSERPIERPQPAAPKERGRQQMHVDPAQTPTVEISLCDEGEDFVVPGDRGRWQRVQQPQQSLTIAKRAAGQFADNENVAENLSHVEQFAQSRVPVPQVIDPHRRIDQRHARGARLRGIGRSFF